MSILTETVEHDAIGSRWLTSLADYIPCWAKKNSTVLVEA